MILLKKKKKSNVEAKDIQISFHLTPPQLTEGSLGYRSFL